MPLVGTFLCLMFAYAATASTASSKGLFQAGVEAYRAGQYEVAAVAFRQSAAQEPAAGTLQSLGNAEWQRGRTGTAVLAWEQALWLNPLQSAARNDLRFARKAAQLETPDLAWYEVVSSWLPANAWAWITSVSLWSAIGLMLLPGILRWHKCAWHQAGAAFGFAIFLLSVPAHFGVQSRSRLGFILERDTPLRLTPTQEAQPVTRLAAGEPARLLRSRGAYRLIRTSRTTGWVEQTQVAFIAGL